MRKVNRLTQRELAEDLFVSYQLVSKWERGISEPSAEMMFTIIAKYNLSVDYFFATTKKSKVAVEKDCILDAFEQSMVDSVSQSPSFAKIAQIANISQVELEQHFATFDDLVYAFINRMDKNIVGVFEQEISKNKSLKNIFIYGLAPVLYEKHLVLNLVYTRPYINSIWVKFITNRYKRIILEKFEIRKTDSLTLEYFVATVTAMVAVWMSQENPESLQKFQRRIQRLEIFEINQWLDND